MNDNRHKNRWLMLRGVEDAFDAVRIEMMRSQQERGPFNSWHEAYAVIKEELDELWDSIKADDPDPEEALQIAACATRLLIDLCTDGQRGTER